MKAPGTAAGRNARGLRFNGPGEVRLAADGGEATYAALPPDPYPILPDAGAGWR